MRRGKGARSSLQKEKARWASLHLNYNQQVMTGTCEHCGEVFGIDIFHCGFSDSSYAYCDTCGSTAVLDGWSKQWPPGVKCTQAEIPSGMEPHLTLCPCGGRFARGNSPRCPKCKRPLSAEKAADYLEAQAPGTKQGWRCQRNWTDTYCAVINGHRVIDNFESRTEADPQLDH